MAEEFVCSQCFKCFKPIPIGDKNEISKIKSFLENHSDV